MANKEESKVWYEGQKTYNIIFTEEDIRNTLIALGKCGSGGFGGKQNEFDIVKTRILFQMKIQG